MRSKPFSFRSCIIYHPTKENGLNRKFDKNNFPYILKAFSDGFYMVLYHLKINELQRLSKIIEKKVVQGIAILKKGCKFATSNQLK